MNSLYPPPDAPDGSAGPPRQLPPALHHRPVFWALLGMAAGLALLLFFLRTRPAPEPAPVENAALADLIALQRAHNQGLEEEIQRLQGLLREDPCALSGALGLSPETTPVPQEYTAPPLSDPPGKDAPKLSPSTKTDAASPSPPFSDAAIEPAPRAAPTPGTIGELMAEATVFILSADQEHMGMGSGFVVAPGIIATNSHVVLGPDSTVYVGNKSLGGMRAARIVAWSADPARDYALLRISDALAQKTPVLRLGSGAIRTERVSAWGFPGYIAEIDPKLAALAKGDASSVPEVVYSEGVVSVVLDRNPPVILHTAAISQGNSGGPLINAQGEVVGINTFIKVAEKSYSQTNIALEAADLALFLREHGIAVPPPLPRQDAAATPDTPDKPGASSRPDTSGSPALPGASSTPATPGAPPPPAASPRPETSGTSAVPGTAQGQ